MLVFRENKIVCIADLDTRYIASLIRQNGSMNACIIHNEKNIDEAKNKLLNYAGISGSELASKVSSEKSYTFEEKIYQYKNKDIEEKNSNKLKVVAYDYGVKKNILRILNSMNCEVQVVPAKTNIDEILALKPNGIFLSNGPGDPEPCDFAIKSIKILFDYKIPIFGICLGHQLISLASGAKTKKMKYGHHGANHPVLDVDNGKVMITSQNHGFVVDEKSLPSNFKVTHRSLFDNTIQGIQHKNLPIFSFQGHPEACPGPQDVNYLFNNFINAMNKNKNAKRNDIKKILILGAGPIVIGQACEFDYSGVQACKALKEEGYSVVLVNSNVATIMTDPEMADSTYIEPINHSIVEKIIKIERPDAILPTMGGQTALNCALDLDRLGILKKYNIEMIGASKEAIDLAEDRAQFKQAMREINLDSAKSFIVHDIEEALDKQKQIGFPVIIRPSFTLGGSGVELPIIWKNL